MKAIVNHIYTAKPCVASGLVQFTTKEGFRYMSHPLSPGKWRIMLEATAKSRGVDEKPCTVDGFRSLGMPVRDVGQMPSFVVPKPVELATAKVDLEGLDRVSVPESLGLEDPQAPLATAVPEGWASTT